jgi:hypothetical protein
MNLDSMDDGLKDRFPTAGIDLSPTLGQSSRLPDDLLAIIEVVDINLDGVEDLGVIGEEGGEPFFDQPLEITRRQAPALVSRSSLALFDQSLADIVAIASAFLVGMSRD